MSTAHFLFSVFILAASVNCYNYLVLNTADRSMNYSATADKCDDTLDFNRRYRIVSAAGSQIPEMEVPYRRCGARFPGWMDGAHPSVEDGVVTRDVCFVLGENRCRWLSKIKVQNCGGFFVYKLTAPSYCNQRYCRYHTKGYQPCSLIFINAKVKTSVKLSIHGTKTVTWEKKFAFAHTTVI